MPRLINVAALSATMLLSMAAAAPATAGDNGWQWMGTMERIRQQREGTAPVLNLNGVRGPPCLQSPDTKVDQKKTAVRRK